jgi:hypothetical protein
MFYGCGGDAKLRIWVQVFGFPAVIYVCDQYREYVISRGFRLEDIVGDQN